MENNLPVQTADDASGEYAAHRREAEVNANVAEFDAWMDSHTPAASMTGDIAPEPFPTNRVPPARQSVPHRIVRNVSEMPKQAAGGAQDFLVNSTEPMVSWLNENVADLRVPEQEIGQPKTGTGQVTRSASRFLIGFLPALKGLQALGAGAAVASMGAGAISDALGTGEHEHRLADFWVEAGLPKNVLTDYLSSKPDDTIMESKFKAALEGVVAGSLLDGVLRGAGLLRTMRGAKKIQTAQEAEQETIAAARVEHGELTPEQSQQVAVDQSRPLVESKLQAGAAATAKIKPMQITQAAGKPTEGDIFINFQRIDKPDDVKNVIDDLAQRFSGTINEARRGVVTHKETEKLADDMGMTFDDLMSRRKGEPFNAETALAARKLWAASAENLLTLAEKAASANAGAVDQFAFRRAMAAHHAIQTEVIAARTETARALGSWRIKAGSGIEQSKELRALIDESGGVNVSQEMAAKLLYLVRQGDKRAVGRFVEKAHKATTWEAVQAVWINGLLSNPTTHVVNIASNFLFMGQQIYERGAASMIGSIRGAGTESVAPGEAMALAYGAVSSVKDAFRMAVKTFRTGEKGFVTGKIDIARPNAMSSEALQISASSGLGRTVDVVGNTFGVFGKMMNSADEFFYTVAYRGEVAAQAMRQATAEGLKGPALLERVNYLKANPSESIRLSADKFASYSTFTEKTGNIGQVFLNARAKLPGSALIFPFLRTPINLFRSGLERTPFAPLVGQWRADIAAGGARADIAMARMATGTSIMLMAMDYADSGRISGSGPKNQAEREALIRQGWKPYSIQANGMWHPYNRLDPIGLLLSFAGDTSEALRRGETNEDDVDQWNEVAAMGIAVVSKSAMNKTYLQGMANFVEMMEDSDRYSEKYIANMAASFVPFTALSGAVERAVDPTVRETSGAWDTIKARVAGLSDTLPARINLWGETISTESGFGKGYDLFSPVASSRIKPSPIDTEIMRLAPIGQADNVVGAAPERIAKNTSFQGVRVSFNAWPKVYEHYARLAGNDYKNPVYGGLGAKDFLNSVVTGKNVMSVIYKMKPDPKRLQFISMTIHQYREAAQRDIMNDPQYADFAAYVRYLQQEKRQSNMPIIDGRQIQLPEMQQ